LLTKVIPAGNILFGSEMIGAVKGRDPDTGHYFDDTKRYVDALPIDEKARAMIFEQNARKVYPRLDARLKEQGR
jgi:4-oxalmesaconate hydratase